MSKQCLQRKIPDMGVSSYIELLRKNDGFLLEGDGEGISIIWSQACFHSTEKKHTMRMVSCKNWQTSNFKM